MGFNQPTDNRSPHLYGVIEPPIRAVLSRPVTYEHLPELALQAPRVRLIDSEGVEADGEQAGLDAGDAFRVLGIC